MYGRPAVKRAARASIHRTSSICLSRPDHKARDPAEPAPDRRRDAEREEVARGGVKRIPTLAEDLDPASAASGSAVTMPLVATASVFEKTTGCAHARSPRYPVRLTMRMVSHERDVPRHARAPLYLRRGRLRR